MKKILLGLLMLLSLTSLAQFSKTHYIPPLVASGSVEAEEQFMYISTPNLNPVNFRITRLGSTIVTGTVSRNTPYVYNIGTGNATQLIVDSSGSQQAYGNKGYIVDADDLVYVSVRLIAGNTNQAGELVSKGLAALGTQFRIGAFRNTLIQDYAPNDLTFVSLLATENNTVVTFSGMAANTALTNGPTGNTPFSVTLNAGQSYVISVSGPNDANREALIGMLVSSSKPIALNCGSFGGTNGSLANLDLGFDQIVSAERTGTEYIFIRSTGQEEVETVMLIANEDNTDVYLNGSTTPTTINAGEKVVYPGGSFGPNGSIYVHSSKNVFAYQTIGDNGRTDQANQELFFVPPLSCETPKAIDNIPMINLVGTRVFNGRVTMVTEAGSTISFVIDGTPYTLAELDVFPALTVAGPTPVIANPEFETYTIKGLAGNVSVFSTTQLYLASYGSIDAATFGGYYSGFTFKPEVSFGQIDVTQENCLPNVALSVSTVTAFDNFQWYFNDNPIPGAITAGYSPTQPGYYHVKAGIQACNTELESDEIPVSLCAADNDGDGANENIDLDLDNDGIINCDESYGDVPVNLSNPLSGTISVGTYTNSFTGSFPAAIGPVPAAAFTGFANGNFTTEVSAGKGNSTRYSVAFAQPVSFSIQYVDTGITGDLPNAKGEFVVSAPPNRTITVTNNSNQLLIDTNYDGIYESGVTQFSSFEIRFRMNVGVPLLPGNGKFSFRCNLATNVTFTHKNLDEDSNNRASFRLVATCVPKDSDGDGVADQYDLDSDNDSVPDLYESQGTAFVALTGNDFNNDGLDDAFQGHTTPADTDHDGIPDYLDLDSDNNGIFDLTESGSAATDANNNGIVDGNPASFGSNGLSNSLETSPNSGTLNFTLADTDADGVFDFAASDNDGDGCSDVLEAGFTDANTDGYLGNTSPVPVNSSGMVTGSGGYTTPNLNYDIPAPISINAQPIANPSVTCANKDAVITIDVNPETTIQWQVSTNNGATFANISDGISYSGTTTPVLTLNNVSFAMNGYVFRALLDRAGNVCGKTSATVTIHVNALPPSVTRTLVQCDTGDNPDGITIFNLSEADQSLTGGDTNLSIAYFLTDEDADNSNGQLGNDFTNTSNPQPITAKIIDNTTGCYSLSTLNLSVNLLPNVTVNVPGVCDELSSEDGFSQFDLPVVTAAYIPVGTGQNIRFYETIDDALLEQNQIANPNSYTNLQPYANGPIYARVESTSANSCSRLYVINLAVYALPDIDANTDLEPTVVCINDPAFSTVLDAAILDGSSPSDYTYQWYFNSNPIVGATAQTLTVTAEGTYSVKVTSIHDCSKTRVIPVLHSSQANVSNVDVVDFVGPNTVTVNLGANNFGDYMYSLDHDNAYQYSNIFTDVAPGIHTVYIKDLNGCDTVTIEISVMGIPKYFTPNGDGYHDTWNLEGATAVRNSASVVRIFDRYGKLLKQLSAVGNGWDGIFNGREMPSDDYWFVIELEDGRSAKGHFTLKR